MPAKLKMADILNGVSKGKKVDRMPDRLSFTEVCLNPKWRTKSQIDDMTLKRREIRATWFILIPNSYTK